jgi:hypothetical protein
MDLPRDWSEFLRLLSSNRVRYLVVGAHALAANGRPRATADLDILVEPTVENARAVAAALSAFGFRALAAEVEAFASPDRMATLGQPPLRIDVMTSISGVTFAEAWRTRMAGKMGRQRVFFLGREALIRNKRASGRTKDLLDIALLEEADLPAPKAKASKAKASKAKASKAKASKAKAKARPQRK